MHKDTLKGNKTIVTKGMNKNMNIEIAKQEFINFTQKYDLTFPKMKRKFGHSFRVMEHSYNIAKTLQLDEKEIEIARLIGLIHDIGHFEQIKIQDILKENRIIDHGDLGVEILVQNNYLRKFIEESEYDRIILKAIKNHNKFKIEEGLTGKELLFSKIVRDADKLDIFYEGAEMFWTDAKQVEEVNNSTISADVMEYVIKNIYWDKKDIKTEADDIIRFISSTFDINFKYDFEVMKRENYINKILDKFDFKDKTTAKQMKKIRKIINEYVENKA